MPSVLDQALQGIMSQKPQETEVRPTPGFVEQVEGASRHYLNEALKDLQKPNTRDLASVLQHMGPYADVSGIIGAATAPLQGLAHAAASQNPAWDARQAELMATIAGMIVPAGPAGEEAAAEAKLVPYARDLSSQVHKLAPYVEDVPVQWLRKLPHDITRASDAEIEALAKDIGENGIKEPIFVGVGRQYRTAMIADGAKRLEAAIRAGYTHIPTRTVVAHEWGADRPTTTGIMRDIIPQPDRTALTSYHAAPSDVFHSLKPRGSKEDLRKAREELAKLRARTYHGTEAHYEGIRDPNRFDAYALDRMFGVHTAEHPGISEYFAGGAHNYGGGGGYIRPLSRPHQDLFYPLEQTVHDPYTFNPEWEGRHRQMRMDQDDVETLIMDRGFRQRPDMLANFLSRNITEVAGRRAEAERMADKLLRGETVRIEGRPRQLRQFLMEYGTQHFSQTEKMSLVEAAREALAKEGYPAGVKYENTAGGEVMGVPDRTSYINFNPQDLLSIFDPRAMPVWPPK